MPRGLLALCLLLSGACMGRGERDLFVLDESIQPLRRSPAESGVATWAAGDAVPTSFQNGDPLSYQQARLIAQLENDKPTDVCLHLRVGSSSGTLDRSIAAQDTDFGGAIAVGVVLIVEWGDLQNRHRLTADARSGNYLIPDATWVRVSVLQYSVTGLAFLLTSVAASLSRGQTAGLKPFTYTAYANHTAGGSVSMSIPAYTQQIDMWAREFGAGTWPNGIGDPNAPILRANLISLYRDYTTGLWVPPYPVLWSGDNASNSTVTVVNAGPVTVRTYIQFLLEP